MVIDISIGPIHHFCTPNAPDKARRMDCQQIRTYSIVQTILGRVSSGSIQFLLYFLDQSTVSDKFLT